MFSHRTAQDRSPNALSQRVAETRDLLDLTVSNPTGVGIRIPRKVITKALEGGALETYAPSPLGLSAARSAVADYYGRRGVAVRPEQVILTATTSEAYHALFNLFADPGDTVLAGRPSYPLITQLAKMSGVSVRSFSTLPRIDTEAIEAGLAEQAKAVVLVSPDNPTGRCPSVVERRTILAAAQRHGAPVISDEVFLDYLDEPERFAAKSFARTAETLTATLSGLSKVAGQPGLKLSWIVLSGPDALVDEARGRLEVWLDAFLSVAAPVQRGLQDILEASDLFQARMRDRRLENAALLLDACQGTAVTASCGEGGWYGVLRLPATLDDEAWATEILDRQAVHTLPGYLFDFDTEAHLVVSLIVPPEELDEGLRRILQVVKART